MATNLRIMLHVTRCLARDQARVRPLRCDQLAVTALLDDATDHRR